MKPKFLQNSFSAFILACAFMLSCVMTASASIFAGGDTEENAAVLNDSDVNVLSGGYYAVNSDITFNHTLTLTGNVTLSLSEGTTMTVNADSDCGINGQQQHSLTVSGQGSLVVSNATDGDAIYNLSLYTQTGGNVTISSNQATGLKCIYSVNISGGTITVGGVKNGIRAGGDVNISGGTVNIRGGEIKR